MIKPVFKNKIISHFKVDQFLQKEEIDNYNEIEKELNKIGFYFSHFYNNIPFFIKNTICKSLGDLINIYKLKFSPRQNFIKHKQHNKIDLIDYNLSNREMLRYTQSISKKELYALEKEYLDSKDESLLQKQIEICTKKAHIEFKLSGGIIKHAYQDFMLPEAAHIYHKTICELSKPGDQLAIIDDYELSTSSIVVYITQALLNVSSGYGGIYWNNHFQVLNIKGRALLVGKRIKPYLKLHQGYLSSQKEYNIPEGYKLATIKDYLNYLNSYYDKLSKITGDKYPKCTFKIDDLGNIYFKVPSLIYYVFT